MRRIIKAELLLTRRCNLKCKYCKIIRSWKEEDSIEKWKIGLERLKEELGCEFVPIYGAEPLMELKRLCSILSYLKEINLKCSVITNGLLIDDRVAGKLIDSGLDSITISVDSLKGNYLDKYSEIKSKKGIELLTRTFKGLRDREASLTITSRNLEELPEMISYFNNYGIWVSFDVVHWSKGQEGSKCPDIGKIKDLIFREEDRKRIDKVFRKVLDLKRQGYLIHMSELVLKMWVEGYPIKQNWQCKGANWLTVDSDLSVGFCDDFFPNKLRGKYKLWELDKKKYEELKEDAKKYIKEQDCRCFWGTHVMSDEMVGLEEGGAYFRHERIIC